MKRGLLLAGSILAMAAVAMEPRVAQAAESAPLQLVAKIPLGEVKGRIDHMAVDFPGQRLFVAELGNGSVEGSHNAKAAGRFVFNPPGIRRARHKWPTAQTYPRAESDFLPRNCWYFKQNTYLHNVIWRTAFMTEVRLNKPENKHVRADRIAREYITAERNAREKKTARLREMRLKMERMAA